MSNPSRMCSGIAASLPAARLPAARLPACPLPAARLLVCSLLACALLACAPLAARAQQAGSPPAAVAIVTSVTGPATVAVGDKQQPAAMGMDLPEGALLRVESGALALVFAAGEYLEVRAGETLTIGKDAASSTLGGAAGTRGVNAQETVDVGIEGVQRSDPRDHIYSVADVSGIRGDLAVVAVSPRLVVSDANPVFCWFDCDSSAAGREKDYVIVVTDERGAVVLREEVAGRAFEMNAVPLGQLGAEFPRVAGRHCSWGVFEKGRAPAAPADLDAAFVFADSSTARQADARREAVAALRERGKVDERSARMLLALYFLDDRERLFADALPQLLALAALPEGRAFADAQIAGILRRFGNQTSVVKDYYLRRQ